MLKACASLVRFQHLSYRLHSLTVKHQPFKLGYLGASASGVNRGSSCVECDMRYNAYYYVPCCNSLVRVAIL